MTRAHWDDWMRRSLAGDESAYRRLLGELATALRGPTRRIFARAGRAELDTEDTVQEILLAIHLKRHTWDADQPLAPWAMAIARYKTIDALRRRGRAVHVDVDAYAEILPAPAGEDGESSDVERILAGLDPRDRAIVEGLSLHGKSAREVGDALKMSEGAVRVALHRALKRLSALYRTQTP